MTARLKPIQLGLGDWFWTREPAEWSAGPNGLVWKSVSGSDFWRHTHSGEVNHSGHGYVTPVAGDFIIEGEFETNFGSRYDQAGLLAIASESHWVKAGTELERDLLVGVVHTDERSDWSFGSGLVPAGIRMERYVGTVEISWRPPGQEWRVIRQLYFDPPVTVGPYSCAPEGPGFETRLSEFVLHAEHVGRV